MEKFFERLIVSLVSFLLMLVIVLTILFIIHWVDMLDDSPVECEQTDIIKPTFRSY